MENSHVVASVIVSASDTAFELEKSCDQLLQIATTSIGPAGRYKMLRSHADAQSLTATSTSRRVCEFVYPRLSPPGRVLAELIRQHSLDGGWLTLVVATSIIRQCQSVQGPRHLMLEGLSKSLEWCLACMNDRTQPFHLKLTAANSNALLVGLARTVIGSKGVCRLSAQEVTLVAVTIVEAVMLTMAEAGGSRSGAIRRLSIIGDTIKHTKCIPGILVRSPWLEDARCPKSVQNVKVACFRCPLEPVVQDEEHGLRIEDSASGYESSVRTAAMRALDKIVGHLVQLRVGLVCCQKGIHPTIADRLLQNGIVPIDRLALANMGPVEGITGATSATSIWSPVEPSMIGNLSLGRKRVIGDKSYWWFSAEESGNDLGTTPYVTLVFASVDTAAMEELDATVASAIAAIEATLSRGSGVVIGGGCAEMCSAHHIRAMVDSSSRHSSAFRAGAIALAHSLEKYATCIANPHQHHTLVEMYHSSTQDHVDQNSVSYFSPTGAICTCKSDEAQRLTQQQIPLDAVSPKCDRIAVAVQAATVLARVGISIRDCR